MSRAVELFVHGTRSPSLLLPCAWI